MADQYETLLVETVEPHILKVTLNRPQAANALNTQMGRDLLDLWLSLVLDHRDLRCVVLTGSGTKAFCAGGDLKERNGMTDEAWQKQHAIFEPAIGFGYPSGHTSGAVLVYGAVLLAVPLTLRSPAARWAVRIACLVLMLLIPWSRMRLGVHWPSDVAGGYLFGFGILAVLWALLLCVSAWSNARMSARERW